VGSEQETGNWMHAFSEVLTAPPCVEVLRFEGGGIMRTPSETIALEAGSFVVHPRGELHEYINGPQRTLLFRVRYGDEMSGRTKEWPSNPQWRPRPADIEFFESNPTS
jgi:hypothetical protein